MKKNPEMTKSFIADEDFKKYKEIILELMKDFHEFLKSHEIKYSLAFGTLLGAIRHNGFIPWDDDIDIILTGEEFKKLLNVIDEFNSDKYLVVKPLDDNPLGYAGLIKIYYKNACMKEYFVAPYDGPFIDIFSTIDIKNPKKLKKETTNLRLYLMLFAFKTGRIDNKTYLGNHPFLFKMLSCLSKLCSKKYLKKKIDKFYKESGSKWCVDSFGTPILYEKSWFNEYEPHKFEQYEFDIVKEYDAMLKANFNDYMKLPPVEMRNPHHLEFISFDDTFIDKNQIKKS